MNRTIILVGSLLGVLAVILGAFGAHGLERIVDAQAVESFGVGVRYQMYHALFLLFLGLAGDFGQGFKKRIMIMVTLGVVLFSCSIYLLALRDLLPVDLGKIGAITPLGGIFLIGGWGYLAYGVLTGKAFK